jgi:hypothetical protein
MLTANMPPPNGGKLTCPVGTVPWVEKDGRTGKIYAECIPDGNGPRSPDKFARLVWERLPPQAREIIRPGSPEFRDALNAGLLEFGVKRYFFPTMAQYLGRGGQLTME